MINENTIKELIEIKFKNEQKGNMNILATIDECDINEVYNILLNNSEIELEDAIYKYMKESNDWLFVFDENSAYRDYGISRGRSLNRLDYEYYIKKDMLVFEKFMEKMKKKLTHEHKQKLISVMDEIMNDIGDEHYENVALSVKFKYLFR